MSKKSNGSKPKNGMKQLISAVVPSSRPNDEVKQPESSSNNLLVDAVPDPLLPRNFLATSGGGIRPNACSIDVWAKGYLADCITVIRDAGVAIGYDHSDKASEQRLLTTTTQHWYELLPQGFNKLNVLKLVKYKYAAFFAFHSKQKLPEFPFANKEQLDLPGILMGGRFYNFLRYVRHKDLQKYSSLFSEKSLFFTFCSTAGIGMKGGCPRPDKDVLKESARATFKKLTEEKKCPEMVQLPIKQNHSLRVRRDHLYIVLRVAVNIVFGYSKLPDGRVSRKNDWSEICSDVKPFVPSTSANYIRNNANKGALGSVLEDTNFFLPVISQVSCPRVDPDGDESLFSQPMFVVSDTAMDVNFSAGFQLLKAKAMEEIPFVSIVSLPEALKVRDITKGPPFTSTVLKPLQRKLWSTVKNFPIFRAIGEPVTTELLTVIVGGLAGDQEFTSLDYSDATNSLLSEASQKCCGFIAEATNLDPDIATLFKRLLVEHVIQDPDARPVQGKYSPEHFKPQKHGQLMGSVVSFPILCLLNAAVVTLTLLTDHKEATSFIFDCNLSMFEKFAERIMMKDNWFQKLPVLINGDDAIVRAGPNFYHRWIEIAGLIGFSPSLGKTYHSKEFLQMNSRNFIPIPKDDKRAVVFKQFRVGHTGKEVIERSTRFVQCPFINFSIITGRKRSGLSHEEDGLQNGQAAVADFSGRSGSIGSRCRELLNVCPPSIREAVMTMFMDKNKDMLREIGLPWFLPEQFGGLGLPVVGKYGPSDSDFTLFLYLYSHYHVFPTAQWPCDLNEPDSWKIRQLTKGLLRSFPEVDLTPTEYICYENTVAKLAAAVTVLPLDRANLYSAISNDDQTVLKAIQFNRKFLAKARELAHSTGYVREYKLKNLRSNVGGIFRPLDTGGVAASEFFSGVKTRQVCPRDIMEMMSHFEFPLRGKPVMLKSDLQSEEFQQYLFSPTQNDRIVSDTLCCTARALGQGELVDEGKHLHDRQLIPQLDLYETTSKMNGWDMVNPTMPAHLFELEQIRKHTHQHVGAGMRLQSSAPHGLNGQFTSYGTSVSDSAKSVSGVTNRGLPSSMVADGREIAPAAVSENKENSPGRSNGYDLEHFSQELFDAYKQKYGVNPYNGRPVHADQFLERIEKFLMSRPEDSGRWWRTPLYMLGSLGAAGALLLR